MAEDTRSSTGSVEEELTEPKFRYTRLLNDLNKVWPQDALSCIAVHSKFIALGTQWGKVFLIDHAGNVIGNNAIPAHETAVNRLSIDEQGEYFASCSNDGKVLIYGLWSSEYTQSLMMNRPVRSVALDPEFSRAGSHQQFATGDRLLVLHERTFFTRDKQTVVFSGKERDGFIHNISWCGHFVAFANDSGIRVWDREQKALITHVVRKHDLTLRAELYPAHLTWLDSRCFVIGWANTLTICDVKEGSKNYIAATEGPTRFVEIRNMWDLKRHYVSGLSLTSPDRYIVVLAVCRVVDETNPSDTVAGRTDGTLAQEASDAVADGDESVGLEKPDRPRVLLLEEISLHDFEIITEDIIEMNECDKLMCHQYHLGGLVADNQYFLAASRDLIVMRPCNADDHVSWLLENALFKKALDFARDNERDLHHYTPVTVGRQYLDHLVKVGQFDEAAQVCVTVCERKKDLWEEYVNQFDGLHQLRCLAQYVPTENPQLEPESYEVFLLDFLREDVAGFKRLVQKWKPDLYRVGFVIKAALDRLYQTASSTSSDRTDLLETLAQLYTYERNYERALALYLKLGHPNVFQLIENYRLFASVKDRIEQLMCIDKDLAVRLLLNNADSVPASMVVKQLTRQPALQLTYLDRLFSKGEGAEFADLAVSLYADKDPKRLLPFLRNSEHYKLDKALEICKQRHLLEEMVFLLGRSGNRKEALKVIIRESGNMHKAIEFCKEHDDKDLWQDMINYSLAKAEFVTILMQNIGTHVDPTLLLRKMAPTMQIPGLRDSLVKILQDYNMQISLQEGCQRVLIHDCHQIFERNMRMLRRGVRISVEHACAVCAKKLLQRDPRDIGTVRWFVCGHVAHEVCVNPKQPCPVCAERAAKAASFS